MKRQAFFCSQISIEQVFPLSLTLSIFISDTVDDIVLDVEKKPNVFGLITPLSIMQSYFPFSDCIHYFNLIHFHEEMIKSQVFC